MNAKWIKIALSIISIIVGLSEAASGVKDFADIVKKPEEVETHNEDESEKEGEAV